LTHEWDWVESPICSGPIYFYRAPINLGSSHLERQGRQVRLVPGMQVNAEIHLGTRSVLKYLLSPVQQVA